MEGYEDQPPAPLISRYWSPGWNSVQALNKFQQEVGGPAARRRSGKTVDRTSHAQLPEKNPLPIGTSLPTRERQIG